MLLLEKMIKDLFERAYPLAKINVEMKDDYLVNVTFVHSRFDVTFPVFMSSEGELLVLDGYDLDADFNVLIYKEGYVDNFYSIIGRFLNDFRTIKYKNCE